MINIRKTVTTDETKRLIFDFSDQQQTGIWLSVNDVVMGRISSGAMVQHSPTSALFTGIVSLKHGGGFASVRTHPAEYNLSAFEGLTVAFKGDGKSYKLTLTDDHSGDGVLFQSRFSTMSGVWSKESFPLDGFLPMFRGRPVPDHPPLRTQSIKTFGLMISQRQSGEFWLEVATIAAYAKIKSNQ